MAGSLLDVRTGKAVREGRVRLVNQTLPLGGATALADFLATGNDAAGLVLLPAQDQIAADLSATPPAAAPLDLQGSDSKAGKSKVLGWTAFGTGIATVALGGVAVWQLLSSNSSYNQASAMLDSSGNLPPGADVARYQSLIASGDSSRQVALYTGIGAGVCLVATGVLGWLSVKQTGEIGPFRF